MALEQLLTECSSANKCDPNPIVVAASGANLNFFPVEAQAKPKYGV